MSSKITQQTKNLEEKLKYKNRKVGIKLYQKPFHSMGSVCIYRLGAIKTGTSIPQTVSQIGILKKMETMLIVSIPQRNLVWLWLYKLRNFCLCWVLTAWMKSIPW